jgi:hypothetical protein
MEPESGRAVSQGERQKAYKVLAYHYYFTFAGFTLSM